VGHPRVRELISFSFFSSPCLDFCAKYNTSHPSLEPIGPETLPCEVGWKLAKLPHPSMSPSTHLKLCFPMVEKIFWCLYRPSKSTGMRLSTTCFPSGNSTPLGHWTRAHKTCSTWSQVPDTSWESWSTFDVEDWGLWRKQGSFLGTSCPTRKQVSVPRGTCYLDVILVTNLERTWWQLSDKYLRKTNTSRYAGILLKWAHVYRMPGKYLSIISIPGFQHTQAGHRRHRLPEFTWPLLSTRICSA
jgi:hypothetical protein